MTGTDRELEIVPARQGKAAFVKAGEAITIINTHGTQVVDTWCFMTDNLAEFMSMEHQRSITQSVFPAIGVPLYSNYRRPLLTLEQDTSPGRHDTMLAACDIYRYEMLGCKDYHDNCVDNLRMALMAIGKKAPAIPSPFNLWMNIPIDGNGRIEWLPPRAKPKDIIKLKSHMESIAVMSSCPQDLTPINGENCKIQDVYFKVFN